MRKSRRAEDPPLLEKRFAGAAALPLATAFLFLLGLAPPAYAAKKSSDPADSEEPLGAIVAPASLPQGGSAIYAYGGVPDVAVGYRQGVSVVELEARAKLNYFLLSFAFEVLLKSTVASDNSSALAPYLGVGVVYDSGSHYITSVNFQYTAIRALAGLIYTYRLADLATVIVELDAPLDLTLNPAHGARFTPLVGGGVEVNLSPTVSGLLMGQLGVDYLKEPLGAPQWSLGYQVRAGFGFRLF